MKVSCRRYRLWQWSGSIPQGRGCAQLFVWLGVYDVSMIATQFPLAWSWSSCVMTDATRMVAEDKQGAMCRFVRGFGAAYMLPKSAVHPVAFRVS